jgi:hypothetical protein
MVLSMRSRTSFCTSAEQVWCLYTNVHPVTHAFLFFRLQQSKLNTWPDPTTECNRHVASFTGVMFARSHGPGQVSELAAQPLPMKMVMSTIEIVDFMPSIIRRRLP